MFYDTDELDTLQRFETWKKYRDLKRGSCYICCIINSIELVGERKMSDEYAFRKRSLWDIAICEKFKISFAHFLDNTCSEYLRFYRYMLLQWLTKFPENSGLILND